MPSIRRLHRIPLQQVRNALAFVSEQLGVERPLVDAHFETDGVYLFVRELNRLVLTMVLTEYHLAKPRMSLASVRLGVEVLVVVPEMTRALAMPRSMHLGGVL